MARSPAVESLIVDGLLKIRDENNRENRMTRVSSVGDPLCKIYMRRTGAKTVPHTAHQVYTFETGHAWHEFWQSFCDSIGLTIARKQDGRWTGLAEIEVEHAETGAVGHFDMLTAPLRTENGKLSVHPEGSYYIADFKTISDIPKVWYEKTARRPFTAADGSARRRYMKRLRFHETLDPDDAFLEAFQEVRRDARGHAVYRANAGVEIQAGDFTLLTEMKPEHRMQATAYAHIVNTHGIPEAQWPDAGWPVRREGGRVFPKVEGVLLCYLAKDHGQEDYPDPLDVRNIPVKCFAERLSERVIRAVEEKFREANRWVERGEMPPRLEDAGGAPYPHFPCAYCEFRHACRPEHFDAEGRRRR